MPESEEHRSEPEWWLQAALSNDFFAAEMLIRLSRGTAAAPERTPPPLCWGGRQPRSKQILRLGILHPKKEDEENDGAQRGSPMTPLSWSGGSSTSGSGDACEDSCRSVKPLAVSGTGNSSDCARPKITASSEAGPSSTLMIGRPRKKKTFAQLKEEENLLLLERVELNKELESLQMTFKELRVKNESLKKLKMDLESQPPGKKSVLSDSPPETGFMLPDLNLPPDVESGTEILHGVS